MNCKKCLGNNITYRTERTSCKQFVVLKRCDDCKTDWVVTEHTTTQKELLTQVCLS